MSFETYEESADSGRPIELLRVSYLTNHFCYTTSDKTEVFDGFAFTPIAMRHNEISPTGDITKSSCTISVPQDCEVGELFRIQPPSGVVTATMWVKHMDDVETKVIWKGRIVNAEWEQPWLQLTSENAFSSLQRLGVPRNFMVQCPHALYRQGHGLCNADPDTFKVVGTVASISGVTVNFAAGVGRPKDYFAGGYITWTHNVKGFLERRMVTESDTLGNLIVTSPPVGLIAGQSISAFPGCDHELNSANGCAKFANQLNYGGMPYIPIKNPFGGSSLY